MIGTLFGGLWAVLGANALPSRWSTAAAIAGLSITALLVIHLFRGESADQASLFRRRAYIVAVVLEVVGLYAAMSLLPQYKLESHAIQVIGFVVGLHFIGLWLASKSKRFIWICASMCAVSLLGTLLPNAVPGHFNVRDAVTAYGCALALWFFARNP